MKKKLALIMVLSSLCFTGCAAGFYESQLQQMENEKDAPDDLTTKSDTEVVQIPATQLDNESERSEQMDYKAIFDGITRADFQKGIMDVNPIMTQRFGADPYAMVYGDTVYFYMTADTLDYEADGSVKENGYSRINTINVISTKDMINFTDHGEIKVAGPEGAATWAKNSWAPAAAWKNIDGQDKFFLYFADSGNGIGVLQADSPVGPFVDPLGHGIITRNTPNCANVLWLFDPAVLVDEDGTGYLYVGGGVPEGKAAAPGTARVARLNNDMISLACDPIAIDVPYLFEDSGIHKYNNKYYYTYCSNFSVDEAGTEKYGLHNGEICCLVSDDPMGPYTYQEMILRNPGAVFGLSGNNHHCVFNFKDQWYITYHTRVLEQNAGIEKGYRCTFVTPFNMGEDGKIGQITMDKTTRPRTAVFEAFEEVNATTASILAGVGTADTGNGTGNWCLSNITSGGFVKVTGVDFADGASSMEITARSASQGTGDNGKSVLGTVTEAALKASEGQPEVIQVKIDTLNGTVLGYADLTELLKTEAASITDVITFETKVTGEHDVYFMFSGTGYEVLDWKLVK